jgi:uncharacterized membrane protein YbaN (DUF454 family)
MSLSNSDAEAVKSVIDYLSVSTIIGVFFGFLPHIAALFTAIWAFFRMLNEIQKWRNRTRYVGPERRKP